MLFDIPSILSQVTMSGIQNSASRSSTIMALMIVLVLVIIIVYVIRHIWSNMSIENQYVIVPELWKGTQTKVIPNAQLPSLEDGYEASYSAWIYINHVNNDKAVHLFHLGNPEKTRLGPGVWIHPKKNDLAVKFSLQKAEQRFTDGKYGKAPKNTSCVFPYQVNWKQLGLSAPPHFNPQKKITSCQQTKDKFSKEGYCPTKVNQYGFVENITDFGSCGPLSMDPNKQPGLLSSGQTCDIENVPLQRWFFLTIVANNESIETYVDGRLVRSCVVSGLPLIHEGDLFLTQDKNFDGEIRMVSMYPQALPPSKIRELYMQGPQNNNHLGNSFLHLINPFKNITWFKSTGIELCKSVTSAEDNNPKKQ